MGSHWAGDRGKLFNGLGGYSLRGYVADECFVIIRFKSFTVG